MALVVFPSVLWTSITWHDIIKLPVGFGVYPLEHLWEHFAHVHEVKDVHGDSEAGVDHDPDLAPLGPRHHVAVADHGDDAEMKTFDCYCYFCLATLY